MKKIALLLALALVMSMPLSALAATPRSDEEYGVTLTFSGTTANCKGEVVTSYPNDYVVMTLKLFHGNQLLNQWSQSQGGSFEMVRTHTVTRGQTYTLTMELMVNGTSRRSTSTTKTC